jgi:hypothetical protein
VIRLFYQLREERRYDKHDKANHQYTDRLLRAALPFLEYYSPNVGECDIQRHKDAPAEGKQDWSILQEAFP